jgi:hypothetical protein
VVLALERKGRLGLGTRRRGGVRRHKGGGVGVSASTGALVTVGAPNGGRGGRGSGAAAGGAPVSTLQAARARPHQRWRSASRNAGPRNNHGPARCRACARGGTAVCDIYASRRPSPGRPSRHRGRRRRRLDRGRRRPRARGRRGGRAGLGAAPERGDRPAGRRGEREERKRGGGVVVGCAAGAAPCRRRPPQPSSLSFLSRNPFGPMSRATAPTSFPCCWARRRRPPNRWRPP